MSAHSDQAGSSTRRQFIGAGIGVVALGSALGACGGSSPGSDGGKKTGPWAFTDDRSQRVSLSSLPKRIVAQEDAAAALWPLGIRPVATFGNAPLKDNPQFKGVDLSGIESVGESFGALSLEKLASVRPDLIVTPMWPIFGVTGMGFANDKQEATVAKIAPIVATRVDKPYSSVFEGYLRLAAALGSDTHTPAVVRDRKQLSAALSTLKAATAKRPGLRVLATSGTPDGLYVAVAGVDSESAELQAQGVSFVTPEHATEGFALLSWENADKYPADVILYDGRPQAQGPSALAKHLTWRLLPAVKANQIGPWYDGTTYNVAFFTRQVLALAKLVERSRPLT